MGPFASQNRPVFKGTPNASTSSTTAVVLQIVTVPRNIITASSFFRITSVWRGPNNSNQKFCIVDLNLSGSGTTGATQYLSTNFTTNQTLVNEARIWMNNSLSAQIGDPANFTGLGSTAEAVVTSSYDLGNNDLDILFVGQVAVGTDTITLASYVIEVLS